MSHLIQLCKQAAAAPESDWALASLVETRGSTYRKPGARLLISPEGQTWGVLSGGCLEAEIAIHGQQVIQTGQAVHLSYDTRVLFGCDGELEILVEKIPAAGSQGNVLTQLGDYLSKRQPAWLQTRYLGQDCGTVLQTQPINESWGSFVQEVPLPVRLLLLGSGPEIAPLLCLSACLGWVTETCPRPSQLRPGFKPDSRTAAVVMTHNLGRDCEALAKLLPKQLPYLGLLGPRKRQAELLNRLQNDDTQVDFEEDWLNTLYSPAGLDIGSETPEEIALSIISEIKAVMTGHGAGFLRDRKGPVHAANKPVLRLVG